MNYENTSEEPNQIRVANKRKLPTGFEKKASAGRYGPWKEVLILSTKLQRAGLQQDGNLLLVAKKDGTGLHSAQESEHPNHTDAETGSSWVRGESGLPLEKTISKNMAGKMIQQPS